MNSRVLAIAVDCVDPGPVVEFWAAALGYPRRRRWSDAKGVEYVEIGRAGEPMLVFQPVPDAKAGKNRLHLDLCPESGTQDDEVARLVRLGATVVSDEPEFPWVILTDPAGNEFCVLPPRSDDTD